jgi:hypothetical protein
MISSISREEIGISKSPAGHPAVFDYGPVRPTSVVIAIARSSRRGAAGFRLVQKMARNSRNGFDSPAPPPYFRGMPPRRRTAKDNPAQLAARMRSWCVSLLRGRAQPLGTVEAPDERAAEAAPVAQFQLSDEQRKRLAVREE